MNSNYLTARCMFAGGRQYTSRTVYCPQDSTWQLQERGHITLTTALFAGKKCEAFAELHGTITNGNGGVAAGQNAVSSAAQHWHDTGMWACSPCILAALACLAHSCRVQGLPVRWCWRMGLGKQKGVSTLLATCPTLRGRHVAGCSADISCDRCYFWVIATPNPRQPQPPDPSQETPHSWSL
jgi:hypothetical protein